MKPEPLKIKIEQMDGYMYGVKFTPEQFDVVFNKLIPEVKEECKEEKKRQVEWLLKRIEDAKTDARGDTIYKIPIWWVEDMIKKAFEDVME